MPRVHGVVESIAIALIAALSAIGTVVVGQRVSKRFGLGTPIEERLNARLGVLNKALEDEVAVRTRSEKECRDQLEETHRELNVQRDLRIKERDELTRRLDDAEARVQRLLRRLGMSQEEET